MLPTRKRMTSTDRREAIVDAAIHLFAKNGFRGTTTRQVAAAVGVSEPVLYEHFETKGDLYTAIIERKMKDCGVLGESLEREAEATVDDREFLRKLAAEIVNFHAKDPTLLRLVLFSSLEGHELADMFHGRYAQEFFGMLSGYMRRRTRQGAFRRVDPMLAARAFVGMLTHYTMTEVVFGFRLIRMSRNEAINGMVDIFLNGMRKK